MRFRRCFEVFGLVLLWSGLLRAEFAASSQSVTFDPMSRVVTFVISFTETPDFFTVDSAGRAATDFQYFITGDPSLGYPAGFDSIIRGGEIYLGGGIPIRNATPGVADPEAGGWGVIRGRVPFLLAAANLTFSVPISVVSDHSTDGHFSYAFQTDVYGGSTQRLTGDSIVTREPSTLPILAALATSCLLFRRRTRA